MPVETRETEPGCRFDQPAHPDKGGTEAVAPDHIIHPGDVEPLDLPCLAVPVGPRPESKELADDRIAFEGGESAQPNHGRVVHQIVTHLDPVTGHRTLPLPLPFPVQP